jgi:hypothetical protein
MDTGPDSGLAMILIFNGIAARRASYTHDLIG